MNLFLFQSLLICILLTNMLEAKIQLIKKGPNDSNTTLLVIAGIHGNEPGSYFAASLLATNYEIKSKNLWIVPNLNTESIMANDRGVNGDMNRKFSIVHKHDEDYETVQAIKQIILKKNISLVLNLHDGHGFYRKEFKGNIFNPNAWGQTCVIDQCNLNANQPFGNLNEIASTVKTNINKKLIKSHHFFDVRNTNTKFDDEQMQLSLTYFAVTNNKPAFAIESSKDLSSLSQKVYYQLLAIEEFMKIMNIAYARNFKLNEKSIEKILLNYGNVTINENISINLNNIRNFLSFIPLQSNGNKFKFSHPLGNIKKENKQYGVYIGNEKVVTLKPQYFFMDGTCPLEYEVEIDGKKTTIEGTSTFFVNDDFKVLSKDNVRVNVIGFTKKGHKNESNILVTKDSLDKWYSIDTQNKIFRIEFYKGAKFCSMALASFK